MFFSVKVIHNTCTQIVYSTLHTNNFLRLACVLMFFVFMTYSKSFCHSENTWMHGTNLCMYLYIYMCVCVCLCVCVCVCVYEWRQFHSTSLYPWIIASIPRIHLAGVAVNLMDLLDAAEKTVISSLPTTYLWIFGHPGRTNFTVPKSCCSQ